jgi:hypothetical protein
MLELYQDTLADLLVAKSKSADPSKLDIKKDPKGMVTVAGATIVEVTTAKQLMSAIETGLQRRCACSPAGQRAGQSLARTGAPPPRAPADLLPLLSPRPPLRAGTWPRRR